MAKYLLMGDIHLSDRAPSSCTDSYNDDIFRLLMATVVLADDHGTAGVIWAGDIFHHKTPGRTSHATIMRTIAIANAYPCPLWIVPGNHDLTHDRLDSIDKTQPLGVLFASGAATLLDGWAGDGSPLYGVPWLAEHLNPDGVSSALTHYRLVSPDHPQLVVTHAPLYPPGEEPPHEYVRCEDWSHAMDGHGCVYYGHIHDPHGVYDVAGVTYCNPGAISRGSLHEYNLTRQVSCALWDSETGQFTILPLPAKPASEVFRLKEAEQARTAQRELDEFLDSVGETRLAITSIESVMHHVRQLGNVSTAVKDAIWHLLEDVA